MGDANRWWQRGIIYQIYPRSFRDLSGDGVGDLPGIIASLDYLVWLGVDALWLSPVYPSPMADGGYDISDYKGIDPLFGTLSDFDRLLDEAHARKLRVIADFVPNHTSTEHPWFRDARRSKESRFRNWYFWRDARAGNAEPNNWLSEFGGSAWEYDQTTDQFFLHTFLTQQADLNWWNPRVIEAMLDVMRFWLDRGVDGFRVDVIWHLIKDPRLQDNPPNPDYRREDPPYKSLVPVYSSNQPHVHEIVKVMREVLDEYEDRVLIGEVYLPIHEVITYYGQHGSQANMPFNFLLIRQPWDATHIYAAINEYMGSLPEDAWPNWVLGNHDKPRVLTRVGAEQARVAAILLLTLKGTPTMYYGDEIGMHDGLITPGEVVDAREKNLPGRGLSRDPQRTPMQWDDSPGAGFTSVQPWLPIPADHVQDNVTRQQGDPGSLLLFYRGLIALRRKEEALISGDFEPAGIHDSMFAYTRSHGSRKFLIAVNLSRAPGILELACPLTGHVIFATNEARDGAAVARNIELRGNEGIIVQLD